MRSLKVALLVPIAVLVIACGCHSNTPSGIPTGPEIWLSDAEYKAKKNEVDARIEEADDAATKGDFKVAISTLEKALTECQTYLGEGPYMVIVLQYLGIDYAITGDSKKAEATAKRALAISEIIYDDTEFRKIMSVGNLGFLYLRLGRLAESEPLLVRAEAMSEAKFGRDAPENTIVMKGLIELYQRTDRKANGETLQKRLDAIEKQNIKNSAS